MLHVHTSTRVHRSLSPWLIPLSCMHRILYVQCSLMTYMPADISVCRLSFLTSLIWMGMVIEEAPRQGPEAEKESYPFVVFMDAALADPKHDVSSQNPPSAIRWMRNSRKHLRHVSRIGHHANNFHRTSSQAHPRSPSFVISMRPSHCY